MLSQSQQSKTPELSGEVPATDNPAVTQSVEEEILAAEKSLDPSASDRRRIPIEINKNVQKWLHFFTVKDRSRFQTFLDRGATYRTTVEGILKKHGVPAELYYLAMIESGYVTHARSRAKAVGAWQFIGATGRRYGLKQTRYVDERRDVMRSTEAAARYLKDLYTAFQSWHLALAAYNAGEGRILGAIFRGKTRDFWELVDQNVLPQETRNYVPKFLAALIVGNHPEKFGFETSKSRSLPILKVVKVPGAVSLADIANQVGVSAAYIRRFNPNLLKGMTPPDVQTYSLWIPEDKAEALEDAKVKLTKTTITQASFSVSETATARRYYRVRHGDGLSAIAKMHGVSLSKLKRVNRLRTNRVYTGQRLRIPVASI